MDKKKTSGLLAFLLVGAFVWLVFDNLALGLLFGLMAGAGAAKASAASGATDHERS